MLFTQALTKVLARVQIASYSVNISEPKNSDWLVANSPINYRHENSNRTSYNEQIVIKLGIINRAQQAHFFESRNFGDRFSHLGLGGVEKNEHYELIIGNRNNMAFSYAIPKTTTAKYKEWSDSSWIDAQEPLYSYVGAINYSEDNASFQSILCASKVAGKYQLYLPQLIEDELFCSPDTEEIARSN